MTRTPRLGAFLGAIFARVFGGRFFGVARLDAFLRAGLAFAFLRLLCKTSLGGSGFALVTLSNLSTKTIPKGQTLFAKKGNETIKFEAAEDIHENGSVTYRTSVAAFHDEGDCSGWY